jgi:hypothetical protein
MERCTACEQPTSVAVVESAHPTSEGIIRYRRCPCGARWIELATLVLSERKTA